MEICYLKPNIIKYFQITTCKASILYIFSSCSVESVEIVGRLLVSTRGKRSGGRTCRVAACLTWWSCRRNGRIQGSRNCEWTSPCCRRRILGQSLWIG